MFKRNFIAVAALTLLLAACAPQGTPTLSSADVQGTAMSAAWTVVAATQQAIPTATVPPPTDTPSPTPLPTFTPMPLPTLSDFFPTATPQGQTSDPNNCLRALNVAEAGPAANIRIENVSDGAMNLSLNLWKPNLFGQCGALSYTIAKSEKRIVHIPRGSWFAYAWVFQKGGKSSTASCSFELRVGAGKDLGRLVIGNDACHALDI